MWTWLHFNPLIEVHVPIYWHCPLMHWRTCLPWRHLIWVMFLPIDITQCIGNFFSLTSIHFMLVFQPINIAGCNGNLYSLTSLDLSGFFQPINNGEFIAIWLLWHHFILFSVTFYCHCLIHLELVFLWNYFLWVDVPTYWHFLDVLKNLAIIECTQWEWIFLSIDFAQWIWILHFIQCNW